MWLAYLGRLTYYAVAERILTASFFFFLAGSCHTSWLKKLTQSDFVLRHNYWKLATLRGFMRIPNQKYCKSTANVPAPFVSRNGVIDKPNADTRQCQRHGLRQWYGIARACFKATANQLVGNRSRPWYSLQQVHGKHSFVWNTMDACFSLIVWSYPQLVATQTCNIHKGCHRICSCRRWFWNKGRIPTY